jgi:hypothetical protein
VSRKERNRKEAESCGAKTLPPFFHRSNYIKVSLSNFIVVNMEFWGKTCVFGFFAQSNPNLSRYYN